MNHFFNLPSNILSDIYSMDNTFRDQFKTCHHDIWFKSFDIFVYNFISNTFFDNKPILKNKFKYLFEILFNNYDKEHEKYCCWFNYETHTSYGEHSMFEKPMPSDIVINAIWKKQRFEYKNYKFVMDSTNTQNDIDDIYIPIEQCTHESLYVIISVPYYHKYNFHERSYGFRGNVLSNKHYIQNLKDELEWYGEDFLKISHYGTRESSYFDLYKCSNDEYTIVQNLYG